MPRVQRIPLYTFLFILLLSIFICLQNAGAQDESTKQEIEFLIASVAGSHLTFVRNGECHTCKEAADHIRKKYDYFKAKIKTPEDFICLCASKSLLSGEPYMVQTKQGEIPVEKWLEQKLSEHAKSKNHL